MAYARVLSGKVPEDMLDNLGDPSEHRRRRKSEQALNVNPRKITRHGDGGSGRARQDVVVDESSQAQGEY